MFSRAILNRWRKSLQTKSTLAVIITAGVLTEVTSAVQYWFAREGIKSEVRHRAESELRVVNLEVEKVVDAVETAAHSTVWMLERQLQNDPEALYVTMVEMLKHNAHLKGCGVGFLPGYYPEKGYWFEPYVNLLPDGSVEQLQIGSEKHDYTKAPWYTYPMESGKGYWSEPYYDDAGGKEVLITYSLPLRDRQGRIVAAFGTDVSIDWLNKMLNEHHIYPSSFNFMVSRTGKLMSWPGDSFVMRKNIDEVTADFSDTTFGSLGRKMVQGLSGQEIVYDNDGKKNYVFFAPIGNNDLSDDNEDLGWSMAVVCSDKEIYQSLRQVGFNLLLLMLLGMALLTYILFRTIKGYNRLHVANVEKDRVSNELALARAIQMSMLPKETTPYKDSGDIQIYAALTPARAVGGDFYDHYVRDNKLFFCIGDVSGKGVPAALVMAVARSMFQMLVTRELDPERIVTQMNDTITRDNTYNIFITLFVGVLDLTTGKLVYCNAGHKAPWILRREQESDNAFERMAQILALPLPILPNLPVGAMPGWIYEAQQMQLAPDSMIFLFTDGLTEAENAEHAQFGKERMEQTLRMLPVDCTPRELVDKMMEDVGLFVGTTEQSDDLTMLAILYPRQKAMNHPHGMITLANDIQEIPRLNEFLGSFFESAQVSTSTAMQANLAIEEAVANVMIYAYPDGRRGDAWVMADAVDGRLQFVIVDSGKPFDPTAHGKVDTTLEAEDRDIGGLGIHLMYCNMDEIRYRRQDGYNILALYKNVEKNNI